MLRDAGVAMIKEQLAFRTTLDSSIVTYLQFAQQTLEKAPTKPWFLISEDSFATLTAGEERVALPGDFLQEVEDATFKFRPSDWSVDNDNEVDLIKDEYDVLRKDFRAREVAPGEPQAYALLGSYFRVFPVPDDAYQVRLIYYKKGQLLTTNIENEWLANIPLLLLGSAGQLMANPVRDKTAFDTFGQWIATGLKLLHSQDVSREMANRVMQIGGPSA